MVQNDLKVSDRGPKIYQGPIRTGCTCRKGRPNKKNKSGNQMYLYFNRI